jgi:phage terminase small subunit
VAVTLEPQAHGGALKRSKAEAGEPAPLPVTDEPLTFLLAVQNSQAVDIKTRVRAAIAAAQYKHLKKGDGGIKDERQDAARKAGGGKFGPRKAPTLVVSNR